MKLITYRCREGLIRTGVVVEDQALDIGAWLCELPVPTTIKTYCARSGMQPASAGMLRLLQAGSSAMSELQRHVSLMLGTCSAPLIALSEVQLMAPVPRPGKIVGVGRNYADHAKETGVAPFEKPRIIFKMPSSVSAPGAPVVRPASVTKLDYEVELAVIIGAVGKNVPVDKALSLVAGYTILNDLSARELQFDITPPQTTFAKSMDGFAPMGPWLVTADEIPDPQMLNVSTWLNARRVQHASTSDMLFSVATLIAYLSETMTLEPGDVIATGTPAGIGAFARPPHYLQPGDQLRLEVSVIGILEHRIA
jgi:2-keto-4-pentenoate hydratase/2-oxohepta-3-ene-1,7-dioic acid hydratase in catechol pathway